MDPLLGKEEGCLVMHWEAEECRRCLGPKKWGKGEYREERALDIRKGSVGCPQEFMKKQSKKIQSREMN